MAEGLPKNESHHEADHSGESTIENHSNPVEVSPSPEDEAKRRETLANLNKQKKGGTNPKGQESVVGSGEHASADHGGHHEGFFSKWTGRLFGVLGVILSPIAKAVKESAGAGGGGGGGHAPAKKASGGGGGHH